MWCSSHRRQEGFEETCFYYTTACSCIAISLDRTSKLYAISDRIDVPLVLGWRSDCRDHLAVSVVDKIGTETETEIETEKYVTAAARRLDVLMSTTNLLRLQQPLTKEISVTTVYWYHGTCLLHWCPSRVDEATIGAIIPAAVLRLDVLRGRRRVLFIYKIQQTQHASRYTTRPLKRSSGVVDKP